MCILPTQLTWHVHLMAEALDWTRSLCGEDISWSVCLSPPGVENKDLASGAKNSSRLSKFWPFSGAVWERCGLAERHRVHNRKVVGSSLGWDCPLWNFGNSIYPAFLTPPRCKWVPVSNGEVSCDGLASHPGEQSS